MHVFRNWLFESPSANLKQRLIPASLLFSVNRHCIVPVLAMNCHKCNREMYLWHKSVQKQLFRADNESNPPCNQVFSAQNIASSSIYAKELDAIALIARTIGNSIPSAILFPIHVWPLFFACLN